MDGRSSEVEAVLMSKGHGNIHFSVLYCEKCVNTRLDYHKHIQITLFVPLFLALHTLANRCVPCFLQAFFDHIFILSFALVLDPRFSLALRLRVPL